MAKATPQWFNVADEGWYIVSGEGGSMLVAIDTLSATIVDCLLKRVFLLSASSLSRTPARIMGSDLLPSYIWENNG